jgi:hypothetical protein
MAAETTAPASTGHARVAEKLTSYLAVLRDGSAAAGPSQSHSRDHTRGSGSTDARSVVITSPSSRVGGAVADGAAAVTAYKALDGPQRKLLALTLAAGGALQRCSCLGCDAVVHADASDGLCARHLRQQLLRPKVNVE